MSDAMTRGGNGALLWRRDGSRLGLEVMLNAADDPTVVVARVYIAGDAPVWFARGVDVRGATVGSGVAPIMGGGDYHRELAARAAVHEAIAMTARRLGVRRDCTVRDELEELAELLDRARARDVEWGRRVSDALEGGSYD